MKIKTSEATGLQLDWGLSLALGHEKTAYIAECGSVHGRDKDRGWTSVEHVNAYLCMGLISSQRLRLSPSRMSNEWICDKVRDKSKGGIISGYGATPEQAVARCVIAKELGDEFECPDELGVT